MFYILAVNLDMKSTDYLLAIGMAYVVIDRLLKIINDKKNTGPIEVTRVTDPSELEHRRQMMDQHLKIIEVAQGIAAVTKSTNEKCGRMEKSITILEDRIVNQQ